MAHMNWVRKIYWSIGILILVLGIFGSVVILAKRQASPSTLSTSSATTTAPTSPLPATSQVALANVQQTIQNQSAVGASVSTTVVVKLKSGTSQATLDALNKKLGVTVVKSVNGLDAQVLSVPAIANVSDILKTYQDQGVTDYAEPNYLVKSFLTPNDSLYSQEWNLPKISAPGAWDGSQLSTGPIAVVDTGVEANHPDLKGEILPGYNFVANTTDTSDDNGHGTHVAGIIEAATNNGTGVASIGFRGTILPVKVLDAQGVGTYADVANGIIYAVNHGAKIINLSLGGPSFSQTLEDAVNYALNHSVVVVAAAGNTGSNAPEYPAAFPGVLAISATDMTDNLASFSSYGADIFASAPGVNILSTFNNNSYATLSGTSMSAPQVAGLLGLALGYANANHIALSTNQLIDDLKKTADKIGKRPYDSSGWNQDYGYGRIDAQNLLNSIQPIPSPTPTGTATTTPAPTVTTTSPSPTPTQTSTTTTSPSPTATTTSTPPATPQPSPTAFSVQLEATIDSVNPNDDTVTVKLLNNTSDQLVLAKGNLVDVFLTPNTTISRGGSPLVLADLTVGEQLHIAATWANNKLTAAALTLQQTTASSSPTPTPTSSSPVTPTPTTSSPTETPSVTPSSTGHGSSDSQAKNNNSGQNANGSLKKNGHGA